MKHKNISNYSFDEEQKKWISLQNKIVWAMHVSIKTNATMDGSVKLFQATRRFHIMGGLYPPQPHQKHPFSLKNLRILNGLICAFFGVTGYFLFLADNMFDYTISFYASVTTLFFTTMFSINIWKTANIYKLLDLGERLLEKSKYASN